MYILQTTAMLKHPVATLLPIVTTVATREGEGEGEGGR